MEPLILYFILGIGLSGGSSDSNFFKLEQNGRDLGSKSAPASPSSPSKSNPASAPTLKLTKPSSPLAPASATAHAPTKPEEEGTGQTTVSSSQTVGSRCGYTVSHDVASNRSKSCAETGQEVGKAMDCFGYAMGDDWCSFSFTNPNTPPNLEKCKESSLFLHDEPGTQSHRGFGNGYTEAAKQWVDWSKNNSEALKKFRARGGSVVGPAVKNDGAFENTKAFFDSCGNPCNDKNSPSYIDVYATNLFMGSWNNGDLVGAINWTMGIMQKVRSQLGDRKVDFTNYSYLGVDATPETHLDAMKAIATYSSKAEWQKIRKVFFFFSGDVGGGTPDFNNRAGQQVQGKTLGHWWAEICDKLDSSEQNNDYDEDDIIDYVSV